MLSGAILLVSSSLAGRRPAANRSATRLFELSLHVEIARKPVSNRSETRSATSSRAGRRPASGLLAGRRPASELLA